MLISPPRTATAVRFLGLLGACVAVGLTSSTAARADPHCPVGSTAPICRGSEPSPTTTPVPTPPPPAPAAEPDILFQLAPCTDTIVDELAARTGLAATVTGPVLGPVKQALGKELTQGVRAAVAPRIPSASIHSVCSGGSQRVGVWSTPITPAGAASRLARLQQLQSGETYALRVSPGFLAEQAKKTLQEPDVRRELAGKKIRYARITTGLPSSATFELGLSKAILAEVDIDAKDTVQVKPDGSLTCTSQTTVGTNAVADIAQAASNVFGFLQLGPGMDIQGDARHAFAATGRRPGCLIAAIAPRQFLRAPLPPALLSALTPLQRAALPPVTKLRFDATRAQGLNGPFEIAGRWNWADRAPKVLVSGDTKATGGISSVTLPLRLRSRDLRDKVTVQVFQHQTLKATVQVTAAQLEAAAGVEVPVQLTFVRKPDALASASYTVRMTDSDGYKAERSSTWMERELPGNPCYDARPSTKCPVTRRPTGEES
jgi:hypothetical protein